MIIFNGFSDKEELKKYHDFASEKNISSENVFLENGQDFDAYFYAATKCTSDYILFFNSYTEIKNENWLLHYSRCLQKNPKTIISATASYQSHYSNVFITKHHKAENMSDVRHYFRLCKLYLKAIFYWRFLFKPFPSPHLRTSAFMVHRIDFLSIFPGKISNKFNAYKFENGRNSMTNLFLKKGYKALVVDKYGKTYEQEEWPQAKTFWNGDQENLLISDNQTMLYEKSSVADKKWLKNLAWGKYA
jgi:hypothetical protein